MLDSAAAAWLSVTTFHGLGRRGWLPLRRLLKLSAMALGVWLVQAPVNCFVRRALRMFEPRTVSTGGPLSGKLGSMVVKVARTML